MNTNVSIYLSDWTWTSIPTHLHHKFPGKCSFFLWNVCIMVMMSWTDIYVTIWNGFVLFAPWRTFVTWFHGAVLFLRHFTWSDQFTVRFFIGKEWASKVWFSNVWRVLLFKLYAKKVVYSLFFLPFFSRKKPWNLFVCLIFFVRL